jgi:hypothetical protein
MGPRSFIAANGPKERQSPIGDAIIVCGHPGIRCGLPNTGCFADVHVARRFMAATGSGCRNDARGSGQHPEDIASSSARCPVTPVASVPNIGASLQLGPFNALCSTSRRRAGPRAGGSSNRRICRGASILVKIGRPKRRVGRIPIALPVRHLPPSDDSLLRKCAASHVHSYRFPARGRAEQAARSTFGSMGRG